MLFISQPRFGPSYRFDDTDLFTILDYLSKGKRVGREKICNHLEMGEGSTRKLVGLMRDYDMLKVEQPGITITRFGKKVYEMTGMRLTEVNMQDQALGQHQIGVVVKNVGEKIRNGVEQRNVGIKSGGCGCTTLLVRNGKLLIAPDWDMSENKPELAQMIISQCNLDEGDTLIVGGGETRRKARVSAVSATLEIL